MPLRSLTAAVLALLGGLLLTATSAAAASTAGLNGNVAETAVPVAVIGALFAAAAALALWRRR